MTRCCHALGLQGPAGRYGWVFIFLSPCALSHTVGDVRKLRNMAGVVDSYFRNMAGVVTLANNRRKKLGEINLEIG